MSAARIWGPLVLTLAAMGCADPKVIRVYDGVPVEGRFIRYEAYAAYGRGLEAEKDGLRDAALRWYAEAAEFDPQSPEIWTRIGALRCAPPMPSADDAEDAFGRAENLDPTFAPLFRARVHCALASGNKAALTYAARAVELDPDDDEGVALYANLLVNGGQTKEAFRLIEGHVLRHPTSVRGWHELYDLAVRSQDAVRMERAGRVLEKLDPTMSQLVSAQVLGLGPLARVDRALREGDLEEARRAARRAHLPPAELAVRAAAMGANKLAQEQAELVLGADPLSTSARFALAAVGDAASDAEAVRRALDLTVGAPMTPPSLLAQLLYGQLLLRRGSREAARAFIGPITELTSSDGPNPDPLFEGVKAHLMGRLGMPLVVKREEQD